MGRYKCEGKCKSCLYHSTRSDTCDYILIVGHSRGCSIDECDKYVPDHAARSLADYLLHKAQLPDLDRRLLDLYEQGFTDDEIGRLTGRSKLIIYHWRKKMGLLPSRAFREEVYNGS